MLPTFGRENDGCFFSQYRLLCHTKLSKRTLFPPILGAARSAGGRAPQNWGRRGAPGAQPHNNWKAYSKYAEAQSRSFTGVIPIV